MKSTKKPPSYVRRLAWSYSFGLQLSAFVILLLASEIPGQKADGYTVIGRVIGGNGRPFNGAGVCIEPVTDTSTAFDSFVECKTSDEEGRFVVRKPRTHVGADAVYFLYVYSDNSDSSAMAVITPPFRSLQRYDRKFEGKRVVLGSASKVDLGDVKIGFWYGQASLKFVNYKTTKPKSWIDWSRVNMRIRNKEGRTVDFGTLSPYKQKTYLRNGGTELDISLPEGRWKVEIIEFDTKRILAQSPYFDTKRNLTVDVRMQTKSE